MSTINGKVCVVDGVAVDKVFSNGRQVYGRNLALGTTTPFTMTGTNSSNQTKVSYKFSSVIPYGTVVTVSFDVSSFTGVGDFAMLFYGFDPGSSWQTIARGNLVNGTQHVSATITTNSNCLHVCPRLDNATGDVTFSNFIISESSKEVPWNPAPEDVLKGDITAPNNLVESQINATTKKLDWK